MKTASWVATCILLILAACSVSAQGASGAPPRRVVERVLANVNDRPIFLSAYEKRYAFAREQLARETRGAATLEARYEDLKKNLFRDMLREEILLERAKHMGMDEAPIIEQYKDEFKSQNNIPNDEELAKILQAEMKMSLVEFRDQIRRSIIPQLVIRRDVAARVKVSEEDVRAYYDKNLHLYRTDPVIRAGVYFIASERENAEDFAYALAERLQGGIARPDVIREFQLERSQGFPENYKKGDLIPELERVALALPEGAVSDPIPTPRGFYIIHILSHPDSPESGVQPFDDVRAKIADELKQKKFNERLDEYFKELEALYFVEIYEEHPERLLR